MRAVAAVPAVRGPGMASLPGVLAVAVWISLYRRRARCDPRPAGSSWQRANNPRAGVKPAREWSFSVQPKQFVAIACRICELVHRVINLAPRKPFSGGQIPNSQRVARSATIKKERRRREPAAFSSKKTKVSGHLQTRAAWHRARGGRKRGARRPHPCPDGFRRCQGSGTSKIEPAHHRSRVRGYWAPLKR